MLSKLFRRSPRPRESRAGGPAPAVRRSVLLVEGEPHARELFRLALEHAGYTVRLGEDAADAVRLAEAGPPDLVVLDGDKPAGGGPDALATLRAGRGLAGVPVVVLTARPHRLDAQACLSKPVVVEQLLATVKKLLDGR